MTEGDETSISPQPPCSLLQESATSDKSVGQVSRDEARAEATDNRKKARLQLSRVTVANVRRR